MSEYITATYPVEIKKCKEHKFLITETDEYIYGEDIEQQYPFNSDIKRIALVESPFDDCVLIITSAFNVRYGIWDNIADAEYALKHEEIVANSVTINGRKEYIVAAIDDDIDDACFSLVNLEHIEGGESIITAKYNTPIAGKKEYKFKFELSDDYFDVYDIDATYEFDKDFDKIAIVLTPLYPKVLLISQKFKLMLTNWDSEQEAEEYIGYEDLEAHYVHIEGQPYCLIADADEDISDVYLQIPRITPVDGEQSSVYTYKEPLYFEKNTNYSKQVAKLSCPDFQDIQELSANFIRNLDYDERDELFEQINHGEELLTTNGQLHAYMYSYGKMHEAKLRKAFTKIPKSFFNRNKEIEVVDYACGQGIATICLQDYLDDKDFDTEIKRISLIDWSKKALARAALLCHKVCPTAAIVTVNSDFDNLDDGDIPKSKDYTRIHLLSNILDMDSYDINELADRIEYIKRKGDLFICVDPLYHNKTRDGRQRRLMELLSGTEIYHERFNQYHLVDNKSWTANITVFKV